MPSLFDGTAATIIQFMWMGACWMDKVDAWTCKTVADGPSCLHGWMGRVADDNKRGWEGYIWNARWRRGGHHAWCSVECQTTKPSAKLKAEGKDGKYRCP
mmetsp:Transcript_5189/g.32581  ORF Transcript_5189/g.32581 Transcript_5189/m.32581 type:complete len:100 (+) Transcript_5189:3150-3449(+)